MGRPVRRGDLRFGRRWLRFLATTSLVSPSARRSSLTAWQNIAASPRFRRGATRGWGLCARLVSFRPCPTPLFYAQVAVGCETGGNSRPDHLGATSRRIFASCSRFCARLTASACLVSFALSRSSLAADCLCFCRRLSLVVFCVTGYLAGLTRTPGGTAAAVLRAYCGIPDSFRWLEGAEGHRRVWSARQLRLDRLFFTTTMP